MKLFLKNTLLFIFTSLTLLCGIVAIPACLVDRFSDFKINKKNKIVLFGHSHPECAFNDSLITGLKNLSHSAEPYFYTYQKVKKVITQNPQIETVLIEFSNNQIDEKMNGWTWDYKYMSNMFPLYSSFMDASDIKVLFKHDRGVFFNCISISARQNLFNAITFNYNFADRMGGYLKLDRSQTLSKGDSLTHELDKARFLKSRLSYINLIYLRKIIDYCKQRKKKLFLVRSPQYKYYEYRHNEKIYLDIKNRYFSDVKLIDFNNFPLRDDEFADPGHLNLKGAFRFSNYVNKQIEAGILVSGSNFIMANARAVNASAGVLR
ncbi:hypothetical protein PQ469_17355 [Mucilaginibacter sp. KACC 22773]|uniref:hypothetical protein n=1 Tax=Mucilaginibacter sp. KACC 22773 TaxID=3025671 RepID=UPI002366B935|nr:hypothetical protein [Mucilaginibacter sp. KACC 22773]WDF75654.1 hypothetical protein PQ469_17355 [Mucilaginibacter sp. KACC 22773]